MIGVILFISIGIIGCPQRIGKSSETRGVEERGFANGAARLLYSCSTSSRAEDLSTGVVWS